MTPLALVALLAQGGANQASDPTPIVFVSAESRRYDDRAIVAIREGKPPKDWRILRKGGVNYAISETLPEIRAARRALRFLDALGPSAATGRPVVISTLPLESRRTVAEMMGYWIPGTVGDDGLLFGDPALALCPSIALTFAGDGKRATANVLGSSTQDRNSPEAQARRKMLLEHPVVWDVRRVEADAARLAANPEGWQIWFSGMSPRSPSAPEARRRSVEIAYETIDEITRECEAAMRTRVEALIALWPEGRRTMELELGAKVNGLPPNIAPTLERELTEFGGPRGMTVEERRTWIRGATLASRRIGFDVQHAGPSEGKSLGSISLWP